MYDAFQQLVDELEQSYQDRHMPEKIVDFISYLMRTWISDESRFSRQIWNNSDLQDMRTNNLIEGWHLFALQHFGSGKNLWKFRNKLSDVEVQTKSMIALVRGGSRVRNRKKSQEIKEETLRRIKERYE